ncbi:hypothetical protein B0H19DRAFT_946954 [Mycena capillaripes]|nr:hypothetical protein B0H19DRAFT_946954 [Mycena capillaripes]
MPTAPLRRDESRPITPPVEDTRDTVDQGFPGLFSTLERAEPQPADAQPANPLVPTPFQPVSVTPPPRPTVVPRHNATGQLISTYYTQPAPANYHTPAGSVWQGRSCDQCGAVELPSVARFRLCGGCMTTQYCSPDCQKIHWPSHKSICQHTANQLAALAPSGHDPDTQSLREFVSAHAVLLGWAGFQALQLKRIPANVRHNALLVELNSTANIEWHRRFSIAATHVVPRTHICDPLVIEDIQHREEQCRANGGIGTAVIIIQCGSISQVLPVDVEVNSPSRISWDIRDDWAAVLYPFVSSGRTDFQPISTTSRGRVPLSAGLFPILSASLASIFYG